ncbi:Chaperone protein fimC precursor [Leminorella richardii]|uniref:Chaperone protein fimC n=2 Tax=Leminorella richardii TaxID=158841 RepID=A0A2X4V6P5_9GAMM|nr:Chaperone protein fimC precursor [Leminorella richardii]
MSLLYKLLKRSSALLLCTLVVSQYSYASVIMNGNRIIYSASAKEKTLQFTNQDPYPNVVQIWLDTNNPRSNPSTADAPFVATPQVFRMEPNSGQAVRLVFTGSGLPQDRESVFYFNFQQIPSVKSSDKDKNKLLLLVSNRLKVFYRPDSLPGSSDKISDELTFSVKKIQGKTHLVVNNPTAYHASFTQATITTAGKSVNVPDVTMVAPKSEVSWPIRSSISVNRSSILQYKLVNDYGVEIKTKYQF